MKQLQQKSTCCQASVWRYGQKRRQCSQCNRTWTVWSRKRGCKPKRTNTSTANLLKRYLTNEIGSLEAYATNHELTPQSVQWHVRRTRDQYTKQLTWLDVPGGPLILIADALLQAFGNTTYTVYVFLVRPLHAGRATILPPVMLPGKESPAGWGQAVSNLSDTTVNRIQALVCDGSVGLLALAHAQSWVVQRCHFHLKQSLSNYVRPGRLNRSGPITYELHNLVDVVLQSYDDQRVERVLALLKDRYLPDMTNPKLKTVIRGFTKHWPDYRSYIYHDNLHLPRSSNTAESCISTVRSLQQKAHGWRTPESFFAWIELVLKHQQTIACNEAQNPQNLFV